MNRFTCCVVLCALVDRSSEYASKYASANLFFLLFHNLPSIGKNVLETFLKAVDISVAVSVSKNLTLSIDKRKCFEIAPFL